MTRQAISKLIILVLVSASAYLGIGYYTERTHFNQLILLFALAFAGYILLNRSNYSLKVLLIVAIAFRLLLLFSWPALSDDYFRFIWDGRLIVAGINPFEQLPSYYLPDFNHIPGINLELYDQLNSPNYFSVYPPVCQFLFALSAWLAPNSNWGMVLFMRLTILAAEFGNIYVLIKLLRHYKKPAKHVFWYALNPLVIVELTGNLHFEALTLFFLLSSIYILAQQRMALAGILFGLAIAVKFLPLLIMPFLLAQLGWRRFLIFGIVVITCLVVLFLPFLSQTLFHNIGQSLNLYFQKFEFNASIYYMLRWLGFFIVGYNPIAFIGPVLSLLTFIIICYSAFKSYKSPLGRLPQFLLFAFSIYFFLATTVHPWYLTTLVALSILTPYRYVLVWSGFVVLSYSAYQTTTYQENLYVTALEYCLVLGYLIYELKKQKILKIRPILDKGS